MGDAYDYVDLPAGSTPLHAAAFFGHLDAAVEILRHYVGTGMRNLRSVGRGTRYGVLWAAMLRPGEHAEA